MTVDEEITLLEDSLRRLKIEFDVYFVGGKKLPPSDLQWRVDSLVKKLSDGKKMSYAQRFRYNGLAQRYAVFSDLWRQKLKAREEGPRRTPADLREEQKRAAFRIEWRDPVSEPEKVDKLFEALVNAKKKCGESVESLAADTFKKFVYQKTAQLKQDFHCEQVEYVVEVEKGQVRLKAKGLKQS